MRRIYLCIVCIIKILIFKGFKFFIILLNIDWLCNVLDLLFIGDIGVGKN